MPSHHSVLVDIPELNRWKTVLGWSTHALAEKADVNKRTIERMYQTGRLGRRSYAALLENIQRALIERQSKIGTSLPDVPDSLEIEPQHFGETDAEHSVVTTVGMQAIELNIPDELIENFSVEQRDRILEEIRRVLETDRDIIVRSYRAGSVKLLVRLTREQVERVYLAVKEGKLSEVGIEDAEVKNIDDENTPADSTKRPAVFIGSSSEGLDIAKAIQLNLDKICDVVLWSQGVFGLGTGTLEALVSKIAEIDYAVLVLTADDLVTSRECSRQAPRDNVLLELGCLLEVLVGRELLPYMTAPQT